jgi:hypothetical protein
MTILHVRAVRRRAGDDSQGVRHVLIGYRKSLERNMRFDEAFDFLVEVSAKVAPALHAAKGRNANSARMSTYGNDLWVAQVAQSYWQQHGLGYQDLTAEHFVAFYDAAWELCRIGVLRPGQFAPMGQGQIGGGVFSGDGYSITEFGLTWLANPDRRAAGDPSRMAELFAFFVAKYGPGFHQRAVEAIRCHRHGNYLAACVMAGAAAESILLAIAVAKRKDEARVLKEYNSTGGRGRVTKSVVTGLNESLRRSFEAALHVLHYWRDDAAHGMATTILEVEAFASLTQLLRLAQLCDDRWSDLTG